MQIIRKLDELNEFLAPVWADDNDLLAYVPTMGALHSGHVSLIHKAKEVAQKIIVSIFVNPLQFGPNEDLDSYPRSIDEDIIKLWAAEIDYLYIPELTEVELESLTKINADREISKILCGKSRSGHFDGVCTIVNHFFKTIKPDFAVFGEKDFQQVKIIEQMILEQAFNITLIPAPIFREASGLAMSSRNSYLDDQEKTQAAFIYESILKEKQLLEDLLFPPQEEQILNSINTIKEKLSNAGFRVDYVEFHWSRIFVAAYLGNTRLIDNIEIVT